jgi:hypothetical protein
MPERDNRVLINFILSNYEEIISDRHDISPPEGSNIFPEMSRGAISV